MKFSGALQTGFQAREQAPASSDFALGLVVVAVLPAVFWTLVLSGAANLAGFTLGPMVLAAIGILLGGFLAAIYGAVASRSN